MTTVAPRLTPLRRQLSALHRARHSTRWVAAWSAVAIAVVVALGVLWALDVRFELSVAQRVIMLVLAATLITWSYRRFAATLLAKKETLVEVALLVEQRHHIDSDLVAALQFESPEATGWGSSQLESAVIERVAHQGEKLNVFDGFSRTLASRRASWLAVVGAGLLVAIGLFPGHARVFWNRLWLGGQHYPTATTIERIAINDQLVLDADSQGTSPRRSAAAQSRTLAFLVRAVGRRPSSGLVRISSLRGGATRPVELAELTLEDRKSRLDAVARALEEIAADPATSGPVIDDATVLPYLECESPEAAALWRRARDSQSTWPEVLKATRAALVDWERSSEHATVYRGELGRLVESIEYKVFLGDAWTDPAEVAMTPRPLVEPRLKAQPPSYARGSDTVREIGPGRLTVLEGSSIEVGLECTNGKRLKEAWLTLLAVTGPRRWNLRATDDGATRWSLDAQDTPFVRVEEDLRFELQVRDEDGLTLETPLAGLVRVQPDRVPSASLQMVHRVVLPQAHPVLQYRVLDDHAVARIELHMEVTRRQNASLAESGVLRSEARSDGAAAEERTLLLSSPNKILRGVELPVNDGRPIDLAPLKLEKGDRLTMVLEVTDHRGDLAGKSFRSEPLSLEISDEAGVLSAVLEADQRAEERLTEIIKRQLGIGEAP